MTYTDTVTATAGVSEERGVVTLTLTPVMSDDPQLVMRVSMSEQDARRLAGELEKAAEALRTTRFIGERSAGQEGH